MDTEGKILYGGNGSLKKILEQGVKEKADLQCMVVRNAKFNKINLKGANLQHSSFRFTEFNKANFQDTKLFQVEFLSIFNIDKSPYSRNICQ